MTRAILRSILLTLGLGLLWASVSLARQPQLGTVAVGGQTLIRVDFPIGRTALGTDSVADFRVLEGRRMVRSLATSLFCLL